MNNITNKTKYTLALYINNDFMQNTVVIKFAILPKYMYLLFPFAIIILLIIFINNNHEKYPDKTIAPPLYPSLSI